MSLLDRRTRTRHSPYECQDMLSAVKLSMPLSMPLSLSMPNVLTRSSFLRLSGKVARGACQAFQVEPLHSSLDRRLKSLCPEVRLRICNRCSPREWLVPVGMLVLNSINSFLIYENEDGPVFLAGFLNKNKNDRPTFDPEFCYPRYSCM